ncbi:hypothetical protein XF35_41045 [Streptomyces platensis subsp. clarensis]|uniref:Uncharacterized protein n=1 Tax=Streptomyces showdoensis TaxID=68268 RepID=A0A2P2GEL0_STREW|nr:hypothetical protein VO63_31450 [Streptomyces showdoensis]MCW7991418.1 hypothetical protein [Streptomyces platensis subsp. clarensis]
MLRSMGPSELALAISGLCGVTVAGLRILGKVLLAREQRRSIATVMDAAGASGQAVSARQRLSEAQWSVRVGADIDVDEAR